MLGRQRAIAGVIAGRGFFSAFPALALAALVLAIPGQAEAHHHRGGGSRSWANVSLTDPDKDAAEIMDGISGRVLYSRNAKLERHPASLTKMMTLYMLFDSLKRGQNTLESQIPVSEHASIQPRTKLFLRPGDSISVDTAIKAIVVLSANDVAVAISEFLGGTEDHFAELMTERARQLGMTDTFYHNASGLPDSRQITTAADLAVLARHLAYDYPQYFHYFSTMGFVYRGRVYRTHDNLLGRYEGADGIKTGYTEASGFNLASSVTRAGMHIIGVVMGGRTAHMRDTEMVRLLDQTFTQIAANPRLVAHATVPWQTVAANTATAPVTAGFSMGNQQVASLDDDAGVPQSGDDEDAAEARSGDAIANLIARNPSPQPTINVAPQRAPAVAAAKFQPPPNVRPAPRPMLVASLEPRLPPPNIRPTPRAAALGEGDIGDINPPARMQIATAIAKSASTPMSPRDWTIQIGAFADMTTAKGQLATYASRSKDVLGQAERIVVPFQSVDGKTLYRARFGPFVEAEARAVCQRMTERGQTCFAALASR